MTGKPETPAEKPADKHAEKRAEKPDAGERIAKRMARAGLCSRRDAERWIAEGRVTVNGQALESPAVVVRAGDIVVVDGKVVPEPEQARLWRYHKPAGLVTTARDEKGRETVFDHLPEDMPRVVSVGRLDLTTEGLLLLTNDGEIARYLELPATGWTRRYRVRVHGSVDEKKLNALAKGLTIEGVHYGPIEAALDRVQGSNAWLSVGLKEGKNREIRKVMESLELQVTRLIRLSYGPFQLGKLAEGAVEEVPQRVLADQLANFFQDRGEPLPAQGMARAAKPAKPGTKPAKPAKPTPDDKAATKPAAKAKAPAARAATARPAAAKPAADRAPAVKAVATKTADTDKPAKRGTLTLRSRQENGEMAGRRQTGDRRDDNAATGRTGSNKAGSKQAGASRAGADRKGTGRSDADRKGAAKPAGDKPTGRGATGSKPAGSKPAVSSATGSGAGGRTTRGEPAAKRPTGRNGDANRRR